MKILTLVFLAVCTTAFAQTYDTNNDTVSTFAGFGIPGYIDAQGQSAEFSSPSQIISDSASNLYVWDNSRLRKITPDGTVSTFIGGGNLVEGFGTNVSLSFYSSIGTFKIDHANTIWVPVTYFSETYFLNIQTNGYVFVQNGGITNLSTSSGICFDSVNNLYYSGGNRIWRYNPNTFSSQVFAGSGVSGHLDGNGIFTEFTSPSAMASDQADNIYVLDGGGLRKIDQSQNVVTITNTFSGTPMAVDNNGNILGVGGSAGTSYIFKLTVKTNVILFAGTTVFSSGTYTNGAGNLARFNSPSSACFSAGSIFVADTGNNRIRQISFNPQPQLVSGANLGIGTYAGVTITGAIGRTYQIQSSTDLSNWNSAATILLTSSPYFWIDQNSVGGNKFYRALLLP